MRRPSLAPLTRTLATFFRQQAQEALLKLKAGQRRIGFASWTAPMKKALVPLVAPFWAQGGTTVAADLRRRLGVRRRKSIHKDEAGDLAARLIFDLLHPGVQQALDEMVYDFIESANETTAASVADAVRQLKEDIAEGLSLGEAYRDIGKRLERTIADPARAQTIARTEGSRAVHAGGLLMAKESGVVEGKVWVAAPQCCEICQKLDGKIVGLEEDFDYDPKGGAYAHIQTAPYHPHCRCTVTYKLKKEWR